MKNIEQSKNNVMLPNFLAFSFDGFDFEFNKYKPVNKEDFAFKIKNKYKGENTIVVFDNKIVFNSASSNVKILILSDSKLDEYQSNQTKNIFEKLNKQNLTSAIEIFIAKEKYVDINLVVASSENLVHYTKVILENNAKAKIFEIPIAYSGNKINYNTNMLLNKDSHLDYVLFEDSKSKKSNDIFCQSASVFENAHLELNYLNLNSSNAVNSTSIELVGQGAKGEIKTITFASKIQKLASFMEILHKNKQTISDIKNIGFVNDFSKLSIDGINQIDKGNSKSEAEQETRIINLSKEAKSIANPQLIINEFDVKAGHSAAVGQVDEDVLFYIQSRGLTKKEAIKLLAESYISPVMSKLSGNKMLENQAIKLINKKIN